VLFVAPAGDSDLKVPIKIILMSNFKLACKLVFMYSTASRTKNHTMQYALSLLLVTVI
jgi:hypothetical protein